MSLLNVRNPGSLSIITHSFQSACPLCRQLPTDLSGRLFRALMSLFTSAHFLSHRPCIYDALADMAPDTHSKALALSSSIPHAYKLSPPVPLASIFRTVSSVSASSTGWVSPFLTISLTVPSATLLQTSLATITLDAAVMGTEFYAITLSEMQSSPHAQSAALAPRKEFPSLIPDRQCRPADIFLPHWDRGLPAALDVCAISTLQQRTLNGAAESQGHALSVCEERKMATHAAPCRVVGVSFIPLAFESLGGASELTTRTIRRIGQYLGQRLGVSPPSPPANFSRGAQCAFGEVMYPLAPPLPIFLPLCCLYLTIFCFLFWPCRVCKASPLSIVKI